MQHSIMDSSAQSTRQQHRSNLDIISHAVSKQGAVVVEAVFRYSGGDWIRTTGEVTADVNGQLQWKDANDYVISWPPPGELLEIKGIFDAAIANSSRLAEEGIAAAVNMANQGTSYIVQAASTSLAQQADDLAARQAALHQTQASHFAQYETARNSIETERLGLQKWETGLQAQQQDLAKKDAELKKASGAEKVRLQKEHDAAMRAIEEEKEELEQERQDLNELMAQAEKGLREARVSKREVEKARIKEMLQAPPKSQASSATAGPTSRPTPRPRLSVFPQPPRRLPQQQQQQQKDLFTNRQQHQNHITISDDDEADEDDAETCRSFVTARSMAEADDFIAESDSFAMDPHAWKGRLSHITIDRTLRYLREIANVKQGHWSDHILDDLLRILRGLMVTALSVPALLESEAFVGSLKTILKRIFIFKETSLGHGGAYIKALSEAVDGAERPAWILQAQRQARKDAHASATAAAPARAPAKKAPGKTKNP
jgi:hypothetical protein